MKGGRLLSSHHHHHQILMRNYYFFRKCRILPLVSLPLPCDHQIQLHRLNFYGGCTTAQGPPKRASRPSKQPSMKRRKEIARLAARAKRSTVPYSPRIISSHQIIEKLRGLHRKHQTEETGRKREKKAGGQAGASRGARNEQKPSSGNTNKRLFFKQKLTTMGNVRA